jgi:peptidoglycan/xylan/chitin deacetylase (PgdA/CDA1 family)
LKILAYRSGLLGTYHRFRNRNVLTVVMFHRVLPPSDTRFAGADPEWTMTPDALEQCLVFFRQHYHIVSPDEAFSALRGESRLPIRSLLITFDDGWADTAEYARPVLEKFGMTSLIFVVGSAVNQNAPFWEERVYAYLATHSDGVPHLAAALERNGIRLATLMPTEITEKNIRTIIRQLEEIDHAALDAVTKSLECKGNIEQPAMLSAEQVAQLAASRHVIGGHGMTHRPLTKVHDLAQELSSARAAMTDYVNPKQVDAMSFPHGAYSSAVIEKCRAAGYHYLFSSDANLNALGKKPNVRPVGRIHLSERALTNSAGRFQAHLLALSLFLRPICMLDQTSGLRNG